MKNIIIFLSILCVLFPFQVFARGNITDWYIKDFETEIIVNKDSSLLITEKIIADCGNLPDKHGIFRILPTQIGTPDKTYDNPIKLISITDFIGNPLKYSTTKNSGTITWKIGDPNITVSGENYYKITYRVENAIRFDNAQLDEFYWNLNGNFWDLEIDNFQAKIIFPKEISQNNGQVWHYTGYLGEKKTDLARYEWSNTNILNFYSTQTLFKQQGITVSVTLPKNIFIPYEPPFLIKYWYIIKFIISILIPIIVFLFCFTTWRKFGKDPKINKTIIPEFEIPGNLTPLEMGLLMSNGKWDQPKLISASIINFAVNNLIQIKEIEKTKFQKIFLGKDFILENKATEEQINNLDSGNRAIFESLFKNAKEIQLSFLKYNFYQYVPEIKRAAKEGLINKELITKKGTLYRATFIVCGFFSFFLFPIIPIASIVSGLIFLVFGFFMPKRTLKGAELNWRIKGFKFYMKTAEKYRQQFNEKENIFEKLLPYAMIFGITRLWTKKIEQIYGQEFINNYHPVWFIGASFTSFNIDNLSSYIEGIAQSISTSMGGSSGAGGGGAGGGGGGGGGGGW